MITEEKSEKGMAYLLERRGRARFNGFVVLGFLRTEKLARHINLLSLGEGLELR
jgi:hypothetical protein